MDPDPDTLSSADLRSGFMSALKSNGSKDVFLDWSQGCQQYFLPSCQSAQRSERFLTGKKEKGLGTGLSQC